MKELEGLTPAKSTTKTSLITGRQIFLDAAASQVGCIDELLAISDAYNGTIRVDRVENMVSQVEIWRYTTLLEADS
jgi:hypothetical protein